MVQFARFYRALLLIVLKTDYSRVKVQPKFHILHQNWLYPPSKYNIPEELIKVTALKNGAKVLKDLLIEGRFLHI